MTMLRIEEPKKKAEDPEGHFYSSLGNILWPNVLLCALGHVAGLYGFYLGATVAKWPTLIWTVFLMGFTGFGITGGAHRLWAHKSYKANLPLRLLVTVGQTMALQNDIYCWCWLHRMHHKYCETDADPFNARRGFFFSHVGWMLCKEHPAVTLRRKAILMSDLLADPIVVYQRKFYLPLALLFGIFIPIFLPVSLWNECRRTSFFVTFACRYVITCNITWMTNSFSHTSLDSICCGSRPYDKSIGSIDNKIVAALTLGEGWHNYHHVFPWDYKAAELGNNSVNWTTRLIDWFADIGWVSERKGAPEEIIRNRAQRTGDGSWLAVEPDIFRRINL